jgi:hypothetical protein
MTEVHLVVHVAAILLADAVLVVLVHEAVAVRRHPNL